MKKKEDRTVAGQANPWTLEEIRAFTREQMDAMIRAQALGFVAAVMEEEVTALCGSPFSRKGGSRAYRGGSEAGSVFVNGRREKIRRPRVRVDGKEAPLNTYNQLRVYEHLSDFIFQAMLEGLPARSFGRSLEPHLQGMGVSKSKAAREHIKEARKAFNELNTRRFPGAVFWALIADGIHVGGEVIVVALGVDLDGNKHFLGICEGSTENADVVRGLLASLTAREIRFADSILAVTDGARALHRGLRDHFGDRVSIQRCLNHKQRNVTARLPKKHHAEFKERLTRAYNCNTLSEARAEMEKLVKWLESINHNAAESMREGLGELLTLHRLEMPPPLRKSFYTSNLIESAFANPRFRLNRVKRWRKDSDMIKCWIGSRLREQERQFRRVRNHREIPAFLEKLISNKKSIDPKEDAA